MVRVRTRRRRSHRIHPRRRGRIMIVRNQEVSSNLVRSDIALAVKVTAIVVAALLVLPFMCVTSYVREWIAVDAALDSGGPFDYTTGKADYSASYPFIPFAQRHKTLLIGSHISFTPLLLWL